MKVKYHIPSFTDHAKLNLVLLNMMKNMPEYFRDDMEIGSVYGVFPPSIWNGGRTLGGSFCDADYIKSILDAFNNQGIPIRFSFTNPVLEPEHLKDDFCNAVMRLADNGINEVIVCSPILEEYIRDKYPNYNIISSTCKRIIDTSKLADELEKDYSAVVIDYDLNNKFDILENLPHKEKFEMLINSCCVPNCPLRVEEYRRAGIQQITYCEHLKKHPNTPFRMSDYTDETITNLKCPSTGNNIYDSKKLPHHISPDLIWNKYLPMGINQFKIEGRTASRLFLIEAYMYYFMKPECIDEARFIYLHNLERNGIIRIDG